MSGAMAEGLDLPAVILWLFSYIVVPFGLPFFGLSLLKIVLRRVAPGNLYFISLVKDGQLGWITLALGCALFFDVWDFVHSMQARIDELEFMKLHNLNYVVPFTERQVQVAKNSRVPLWCTLIEIGMLVNLMGLMVITPVGSVFPTPYRWNFPNWRSFGRHYLVFFWTALASLLGSASYLGVHLWIKVCGG
jgi:hypothetical protein